MSGYTPVFDTIFQGSLCGKYPDLPVWLVLLAMQQRGGIIDAHPSYIATVSGIPQTDVEAAIARFCEPDPSSRTPENDGRRLEALPDRGFGWRVLNHEKYRRKASRFEYDRERTESGRDADRKRLSRPVPTCPDKSRQVPPSEAEAEAEREGAKAPRARSGKASKRCPPGFQPDLEYAKAQIIDLNAEAEAERFRDFEFKTPRSDWPAAWRNWIRTCKESGKYARAGKTIPGMGAVQWQ